MTLSRDWKIIVGIFLVSIFILIQGLDFHGVEFRDDEVFYYKSVQEMLSSGNVLSPTFLGSNRFQKPILFYWLILGSFKIFGVSWFAARLVSVVFAALTIILTWLLARDLFNRTTATLSAGILLTSPLFFRHAKGAVPDMPMNFFIVLALYAVFKFIQDPARKLYPFIFFTACGLGFMVKGFAAIVVPFLTLIVYALLIRRQEILRKINFPAGMAILGAIILPWFLYMLQVHGDLYARYMLINETQNRFISQANTNVFVKILTAIFHNLFFYGQVLMIYFAPWSAFLIGAIPLTVVKFMESKEHKKTWGFLAVWFWVVFIFFTCLFININHYLLVLSTPLAILTSAFLMDLGSRSITAQKIIKGFMVFLMIGAGISMIFLHVFLADGHVMWILFYIFVFLIYCRLVREDRSPVLAPLMLAVLLAGIFAVQTKFMMQTGLSTHSAWQRMADLIEDDCRDNCAVAVGSHDLHEKELQVYFDRKVEKLGTNYHAVTEILTKQFLDREDPQSYCFITVPEYTRYMGLYDQGGFRIMAKDSIARKRFYLDKEFFPALATLNRPKVLSYLKETVILLQRDLHE